MSAANGSAIAVILGSTNRPAQGRVLHEPADVSTASHQDDPCAITADRLAEFTRLPLSEEIDDHARALNAARDAADLTTPGRVRHFMAQIAHETGGFTRFIEGFRYSDAARLDRLFSNIVDVADARRLMARGPIAIANRVYAGRMGNGSERSGDGWTFKGRGYLQITGRETYRHLGEVIGRDLEACPECLALPSFAAAAAAIYWRNRQINAAADADDLVAVTRLINPALAGLDDRRAWLGRARRIWP